MRWICFLLCLLATPALAADNANTILRQVYGVGNAVCTQDADADVATANILGPFVAGQRYVVYGHDGPPGTGTGVGKAIECVWGGASVTGIGVVGQTIFAGEKVVFRVDPNNLYISCIPFEDDMYYDVCPKKE